MSFTDIINWLITSSKDPSKISLTIKGALGTVATVALVAAGIFHYTLAAGDVNNLVDLINAAVSDTFTAISYVITAISAWALVWGALRKLWLGRWSHPDALQ